MHTISPFALPTALSGRLAELIAVVTGQLRALPDKPEENAEATIRALWHKAAGNALCVEAACQTALPDLDAQRQATLQTLIAQRLSGIPLAHLTGRQQFMGIELLADARALIPRKESELLGHTALDILRATHKKEKRTLRAIDLCTGAGNLACALAAYMPQLQITGSDITIDALHCAMENRSFLNLDHQRVGFIASDLLNAFNPVVCRQNISMIICNPPYISKAKVNQLADEILQHEPRQAFDGGPLGLTILSRLCREGADYLADQGWICCEVGLGQGKWLAQRFERTNDYRQVVTTCDPNGEVRVVAAQKK